MNEMNSICAHITHPHGFELHGDALTTAALLRALGERERVHFRHEGEPHTEKERNYFEFHVCNLMLTGYS